MNDNTKTRRPYVRHAKGCSRRLKSRWSGQSCDCGARQVGA